MFGVSGYWRRLLVVGFSLSLLSGCYKRERTNPFDPNGPQNGAGIELHVSSERTTVFLDWSRVESPDLVHYIIYKGTLNRAPVPYDTLEADQLSFTDTHVSADSTYIYGITLLGHQSETPLNVLDTITPGYSRWWVLSSESSDITELSSDGLHKVQSIGYFSSPRLLTTYSNSSTLFVYDLYSGTMYSQSGGHDPVLLLSGIYQLQSVLFNHQLGELVLVHYNHNLEFYSVTNDTRDQVQFDHNITASGMSSNGRVWIATGDSLYFFNPGVHQSHLFGSRLTGQSITAITPVNSAEIFIARQANGLIQKVSADSTITLTTEIPEPVQLTYDASTENLWVRAFNKDSNTFEVYLYQNGVIQKMLSGISYAFDFAVNPITHSCLIADYDRNIVYRIDPDGTVRHTGDLPGGIHEIVVQTLGNN